MTCNCGRPADGEHDFWCPDNPGASSGKRDESTMSYDIVDGRITDPGKFENEPEWAPYFYEKGMGGFSDLDVPESDEGHAPLWAFIVTAEDLEKFPSLVGTYAVAIEESEQGFVYATELTKERYEALERES